MGKDLPEFRRQVGIEPAPIIADAGAPFEELSKVLDQFSGTAARFATRAATARAAQAGAETGAAPDFKGNLAPGFTAPTRAFNEAALAANKVQLQTDIRSGIQGIHDLVTQNLTLANKPIQSYDEEATKFYQREVANVPPQNRQFFDNLFQYEAGNGRRSIVQKTNFLGLQTAQQEVAQNRVATQNEAFDQAYNQVPQAAAGLSGLQHQTDKAAVASQIISQPVVDNIAQKFHAGLQSEGIKGGHEVALRQGTGQKYFDDYQKAKIPDMDPVDRHILTAQMLGQTALWEQGQEAQHASLKVQYMSYKEWLQSGVGISPGVAAQYPLKSHQLWEENRDDYEKSRLINAAVTALRFVGSRNRQTALTAIAEEVTRLPSEINHQQVFNMIQRISKKQVIAQHADAAGYDMQHPAVKEAFAADEARNKAVDEATVAGGGPPVEVNLVGNKWDTLIAIEKSQGIPSDKLSVIPKAVSANMAFEINQMPIDQQLSAVQRIVQTYGTQQVIALRDLHKAGVSLSVGWALTAAHNPASSPYMREVYASQSNTAAERKEVQNLALSSALTKSGAKVTPSMIDNAINTNLKDMDSSLEGSNGSTTLTRIRIHNDVRTLAYQLIADNRAKSWQDAVKVAAGIVVNNNYSFASQGSHPVLRVPVGENANDILAGLGPAIIMSNSQRVSVPAFIRKAHPDATDAELQELTHTSIQDTGRWISNTTDTGVLLVYGTSSNGQPVLDAEGNIFDEDEFTYQQFNLGTSKISKMIAASPVPRFLLGHTLPSSFTGEVVRGFPELVSDVGKLQVAAAEAPRDILEFAGRIASGVPLSDEQANTLINSVRNVNRASIVAKQLGTAGIKLGGKLILQTFDWVRKSGQAISSATLRQLMKIPRADLKKLIEKPFTLAFSEVIKPTLRKK